jgi:hypothetical protein
MSVLRVLECCAFIFYGYITDVVRMTLFGLLGVSTFCAVLSLIIFPQERYLQATTTFAVAESWETYRDVHGLVLRSEFAYLLISTQGVAKPLLLRSSA